MSRNGSERGFTLIEILVVIFIVGLIVAMVLPAIQSAREAARRTQCKNHLKQLGLAALAHHEQIGHFPTSGWGWRWVGDPDRGFGKEQPGNWTYNLLPFMEEEALHALPTDGLPRKHTDGQLERAKGLVEQAIPILYCPSRRAPIPYPHDASFHFAFRHLNALKANIAGKLDYAINGGDTSTLPRDRGPGSLREAENHSWPFTTTGTPLGVVRDGYGNPDFRPPEYTSQISGEYGINGVSFVRSEVAMRHVSDGASNTYLVGEYYYDVARYETGGGADAWCTALHGRATGFNPPLRVWKAYGWELISAVLIHLHFMLPIATAASALFVTTLNWRCIGRLRTERTVLRTVSESPMRSGSIAIHVRGSSDHNSLASVRREI